ncbi:hypothetical protein CBR_g38399 [Chara braunii]|uniref:ATP-dependent RNA helicase n=1 Tax=Chara braunii TaxID=69332 RepID=A0A388JNM0_CHABU|nr:hypothetical protein CBR_g38399 [Chara braunii]|eukprot:GBG59371.1 hypothetical protein CBR_g38399 [Chara braunii]
MHLTAVTAGNQSTESVSSDEVEHDGWGGIVGHLPDERAGRPDLRCSQDRRQVSLDERGTADWRQRCQGGKGESEYRLNIKICAPGRLLQHMDEAPNFDSCDLQMLVLDEADRILDLGLGFAKTLNAIIANLPMSRQTLLFSATQTKSVRDLARLSLRDPEYLSVHAESAPATPSEPRQSAIMCPLHKKLDILWSFIKSHLRGKILVFLTSCKQVKFGYEAFRRLPPGVPLKCLHGKMKQMQRMVVFYEYCESKSAALFATGPS